MMLKQISRDELRPFFWWHARTPHTQIHYRTYMYMHVCGCDQWKKGPRARTLHTCFRGHFAHTHVCDRTSHVCVRARTFATHPLGHILVVSMK
jgi:hypothetical protein